MSGENAVGFDFTIASAYDRTRPFCTPEAFQALIAPVITAAFAEHSKKKSLKILDAGCGTGRVSIPFLLACASIEEARAGQSLNTMPIELVAVDRSPHMLRHYQKNLIEKAVPPQLRDRLNLQHADIRDNEVRAFGPFQLIIAHWLFHTMLDWRTAALQLDAAAEDGSLALFFREESGFYRALDGDIDPALDPAAKDFWNRFHSERRARIRSYKRGREGDPVFLPPSMRLGPKVSDERVADMFSAFGWQELPLADAGTSYSKSFTIEDLIELVAYGRTFTNLRIGADQRTLEEIYSDLAQNLHDYFSDHRSLNREVLFEYSLVPRLFRKEATRTIHAPLLVDIVRDTISVRRSHAGFDLYDRERLWTRLFETVLPWLRLPGTTFDLFGDALEFIVAVPPYGQRPYVRGIFEGDSQILNKWLWLCSNVETDDVIHLYKEGVAAAPSRKGLLPYACSIAVSPELWDKLASVGSRWNTPADDNILIPVVEDCATLLHDAKRAGLLGFDEDVLTYRHFIGSLAQHLAAAPPACQHLYLFPVRESFEEPAAPRENHAFGMLIGSKQALKHETISILWLIVDLLIIDFKEHGATTKATKSRTEKMSPTDTKALYNPQFRASDASAYVQTGADGTTCDVLVLSVNERERLGIQACFTPETTRAENLPRRWESKTGTTIIQAEIEKSNCLTGVQQALETYGPRLAVLCGVGGGGRPDEQGFADVMVASSVILIDQVDELEGGDHLREGAMIEVMPEVDESVQLAIDQWKRRRFRQRDGLTRVHYGPILSSARYKGDPGKLYEQVAKHEAIGCEMEAHEFVRAVNDAKVPWLVIKGICDFAEKYNYYQVLAAYRAANFLRFMDLTGNLAWIRPH